MQTAHEFNLTCHRFKLNGYLNDKNSGSRNSLLIGKKSAKENGAVLMLVEVRRCLEMI